MTHTSSCACSRGIKWIRGDHLGSEWRASGELRYHTRTLFDITKGVHQTLGLGPPNTCFRVRRLRYERRNVYKFFFFFLKLDNVYKFIINKNDPRTSLTQRMTRPLHVMRHIWISSGKYVHVRAQRRLLLRTTHSSSSRRRDRASSPLLRGADVLLHWVE